MSSGGSKTRKPKPRVSVKKSNSQNSVANLEGVYSNPRLVHTLFKLVGSKCEAQVKNGGVYSGVFHTFSPGLDIVVGAAHMQETSPGAEAGSIQEVNVSKVPCKNDIIDQLIFKSKDVVSVTFHDVDVNYAEVPVRANGDFGLESRNSANGTERCLKPWDGGGDTSPSDIGGLEESSSSATANGTNGWGPEEMFRTNSERYGVQSSYNPELPEYTTPLENENSANYEKRKARANKLAQEIESSPTYMKHVSLEVDDSITEEEKFSSVSRPASSAPVKDPIKSRGNKGRGRDQGRDQGRDNRGQRSGHHSGYYSGSGGPQRGGSYAAGPGRSNTPINSNESVTSPSGQGKFGRNPGAQSSGLPPRFAKVGYPRDDDRLDRRGGLHENRLVENTTHHSTYMHQGKPQRMSGNQQRGGYGRNHPSSAQDYNNHPGDASSIGSGQNTPQSLSRNSSGSSVNQQISSPQWNNKGPVGSSDERPHPGSASNAGGHPSLTRNLSSGSGRENSYSSVVQSSNSAAKVGQHSVPPPAGAYPDRSFRQPHGTFRPAMPTTGGSQPKFSLYPQGHSPPVGANQAGHMVPSVSTQASIQQAQRQIMQQPYSAANVAAPHSNAPPPPPSLHHQGGHRSPALDVSTKSKKNSALSNNTSLKPQEGSSSTDVRKDLKQFHSNFILAEENTQSNTVSTDSAPHSRGSSVDTSASKITSKSMSGSQATASVVTSPKEVQPARLPGVAHPQRNYSHPHHTPRGMPVIPNPVRPDAQPVIVVPAGMPSPAIIPQSMMTQSIKQGMWAPDEMVIVPPANTLPQPSINVPSPQTATTATDVVTVSAATAGPFVPSPIAPETVSTGETFTSGATTPPIAVVHPKGAETASDVTPTTGEKGTVKLNPDAKEFIPSQTPAAVPPSPTPVTLHQPGPATYYTSTGQVIPPPNPSVLHYVVPAKSVPKQGATIVSPSPNDPPVLNMPPHMTPHMHPTTAGGHAFIAQSYSAHAAPLVYAQPHSHQPVAATPQPGIMPPQVSFQNVEQMVYNPNPAHIIQSTTPRGLHGYPSDSQLYGYAPIQHQQQAPPQPAQQQQPAYMQQQRPHSAHTPNQAHIPAASPGTNIQTQSSNGIPTNLPPQAHPPTPNQMPLSQNHFYPPLFAAHTAMHNHMMPNNPHGSYSSIAGRQAYMVVPGNASGNQQIPPVANPPGQQGYIQTPVVSAATHIQSQYNSRHTSYTHQQPAQVIQGYQQQPPN